MTLRPLTIAIGLALSGCTLATFLTHKGDLNPVAQPDAKPAIVATPSMDTRVPATRNAEEYTYRLLTPDDTGLRQVFDDGRNTYVQFTSATIPTGLMLFDENGKAVPFTRYGQTAVLNSLHQGLLIRTATKNSYAQPTSPGRIAQVQAAKPGQPVPTTHLPAELAAARAQIREAQGRLRGLAAKIDKASRGEPSASVTQLSAEIDELQTQIAGITATMVRARFEPGSTALVLSASTRQAILAAAKLAQKIEIRGRTDATGTLKGNSQIAFLRAVNTRKMLVAGGITPAKLRTTFSHGDYIAPNTTAAGRAQNRRVEMVLFGDGTERVRVVINDTPNLTLAANPPAASDEHPDIAARAESIMLALNNLKQGAASVF